jgi:hypothetical protein
MEKTKNIKKGADIKAARNSEPLTLAPLDFEQALENLLQVKPEKKIAAPKKKSKLKTKK